MLASESPIEQAFPIRQGLISLSTGIGSFKYMPSIRTLQGSARNLPYSKSLIFRQGNKGLPITRIGADVRPRPRFVIGTAPVFSTGKIRPASTGFCTSACAHRVRNSAPTARCEALQDRGLILVDRLVRERSILIAEAQRERYALGAGRDALAPVDIDEPDILQLGRRALPAPPGDLRPGDRLGHDDGQIALDGRETRDRLDLDRSALPGPSTRRNPARLRRESDP